jgi:DNA-binding transcriptional MocR family regulator
MAAPVLKIDIAAGGAPIVDQLADGIAGLIESRRLAAGRKLPSIRAFATANGVSKTTVVDAFDRLVARGLLISKNKVGFFVAGPRPMLDLVEQAPPVEREIDPLWSLRQALLAGPEVLKPGSGSLPEDWMDAAGIRRALRALARSSQTRLTDYGQPLGFAPLRAQLQGMFAERGVDAPPGQILLTDGAMQGIDLVGRLLLQPGDAVLVDDPGYYNVVANLYAHRARIVGVPYRENGPDLEVFAAQAAQFRPRLYITNAAIHNPTGATLSAATAHRLLTLAEEFDVAILEDDIYADFEERSAPRLAALDQLDRVIYVGSFSKTLSSAARCGWIAARADWIEGLVDLKLASAISSNELSAQLAHAMLTGGGYRKHMQGIRNRLCVASVDVRKNLEQCGLTVSITPPGGMFLWAALPDGIDSADVARAAAAEGVAMAPGDVFSVSHTAGSFLRFNVAQSRHQRIWTFLKEAARLRQPACTSIRQDRAAPS